MLLLESNHDLEMLKVGPYPWSVKQRVMGRNGHLSNATPATTWRTISMAACRRSILGHLSEQNNHPEIVRMGAEQSLVTRAASRRVL